MVLVFPHMLHGVQVLLAWSRTKVLVSFRGTASLVNAFADIQVRFPLHLGAMTGVKSAYHDCTSAPRCLGTLLQCREMKHLFHAVWLDSALMLALCLA